MFGKKKRVPKRPVLIIKDDFKDALFNMKSVPFDPPENINCRCSSIPFEEYSGGPSGLSIMANDIFNRSKYPYGMGKEWEFEK